MILVGTSGSHNQLEYRIRSLPLSVLVKLAAILYQLEILDFEGFQTFRQHIYFKGYDGIQLPRV